MHKHSTTHDTPSPISAAERATILAAERSNGRKPRAQRLYGAFIYARESDPELQDSIPHQLDEGRTYAHEHKLPILGEYNDGMSGLDTDRPDYLRKLQRYERGEGTDLILWEPQRFGRDDLEFIRAMVHLMELGVTIHDREDGPLARDDVARLAYEANRESRRNSRRVRSKQRFRASQGQPQSRLPLGLMYEYDHDEKGDRIKPGRVVIDPKAGPAVQRCLRDYAAGKSRRAVTDQLNAELGLHKAPAAVSALMKRHTLNGVYVWGKRSNGKITGDVLRPSSEWEVSRLKGEQLVDDETFQAVQARLAQHNSGYKRPQGRRDLLQGFLWCGLCYKRMRGMTHKNGSQVYRCDVCGRSRSMKQIDAAVRSWISYDTVSRSVDEGPRPARGQAERVTTAQLAELEGRLKAVTAERVELTRQYARGEIQADDYHAALAVTEQERNELRAEIGRLEAAAEQARLEQMSAAQFRAWLRQHATPDDWSERAGNEDFRYFLQQFVERLIYDRFVDTLTVRFTRHGQALYGSEAWSISVAKAGAPTEHAD